MLQIKKNIFVEIRSESYFDCNDFIFTFQSTRNYRRILLIINYSQYVIYIKIKNI